MLPEKRYCAPACRGQTVAPMMAGRNRDGDKRGGGDQSDAEFRRKPRIEPLCGSALLPTTALIAIRHEPAKEVPRKHGPG
jgi:hypothetical protein